MSWYSGGTKGYLKTLVFMKTRRGEKMHFTWIYPQPNQSPPESLGSVLTMLAASLSAPHVACPVPLPQSQPDYMSLPLHGGRSGTTQLRSLANATWGQKPHNSPFLVCFERTFWYLALRWSRKQTPMITVCLCLSIDLLELTIRMTYTFKSMIKCLHRAVEIGKSGIDYRANPWYEKLHRITWSRWVTKECQKIPQNDREKTNVADFSAQVKSLLSTCTCM